MQCSLWRNGDMELFPIGLTPKRVGDMQDTLAETSRRTGAGRRPLPTSPPATPKRPAGVGQRLLFLQLLRQASPSISFLLPGPSVPSRLTVWISRQTLLPDRHLVCQCRQNTPRTDPYFSQASTDANGSAETKFPEGVLPPRPDLFVPAEISGFTA